MRCGGETPFLLPSLWPVSFSLCSSCCNVQKAHLALTHYSSARQDSTEQLTWRSRGPGQQQRAGNRVPEAGTGLPHSHCTAARPWLCPEQLRDTEQLIPTRIQRGASIPHPALHSFIPLSLLLALSGYLGAKGRQVHEAPRWAALAAGVRPGAAPAAHSRCPALLAAPAKCCLPPAKRLRTDPTLGLGN